jgi:hypothetical protein
MQLPSSVEKCRAELAIGSGKHKEMPAEMIITRSFVNQNEGH